jgi:hypothetical protein
MLDLQRLLTLAGINESLQLDEAREDDAAKNAEGILAAYSKDDTQGKPTVSYDANDSTGQAKTLAALEIVKFVSSKLGMPANKSIVRVMQWYANSEFKLDASEDGDLASLKTRLEAFEKPAVKAALVAASKPNTILQYPNYSGFIDAVDPIIKLELKSGKEQRKEAKADVEKLIDGANFKVYIPLTEKSSQLYGRGTDWCTAYTDKPNKFNEYHAQGSIYVILIPTNEANGPKVYNGFRKYQLHMENNEFKDALNHDVSREDVAYLSKIPEYKKFLEYLIQKYYAK